MCCFKSYLPPQHHHLCVCVIVREREGFEEEWEVYEENGCCVRL